VKSIGVLTTPPVNSPGRYKLKTKRTLIAKTPRFLPLVFSKQLS
jgi:hypothetical protein